MKKKNLKNKTNTVPYVVEGLVDAAALDKFLRKIFIYLFHKKFLNGQNVTNKHNSCNNDYLIVICISFTLLYCALCVLTQMSWW